MWTMKLCYYLNIYIYTNPNPTCDLCHYFYKKANKKDSV